MGFTRPSPRRNCSNEKEKLLNASKASRMNPSQRVYFFLSFFLSFFLFFFLSFFLSFFFAFPPFYSPGDVAPLVLPSVFSSSSRRFSPFIIFLNPQFLSPKSFIFPQSQAKFELQQWGDYPKSFLLPLFLLMPDGISFNRWIRLSVRVSVCPFVSDAWWLVRLLVHPSVSWSYDTW